MYKFDYLLTLIAEEIKLLDWQKTPQNLYRPIEYLLSLGGKRVRPAIVLMSCNLFTEDIQQAMSAAVALEVFHNFTLLHDDIMDKAEMRRGKPTVHQKWSDNVAILSGDTMQIISFQLMNGLPNKYLKEAMQIFTKLGVEICEGQQLDMDFEKRDDVRLEEYIEMIKLKTAVLIAGGAEIGGLVGDCDTEDARLLYDFGLNLGLAFQLRDDLLDVYGEENQFGKRIGGDILCNKKTFLLINALKKSDTETDEDLKKWLETNDKNLEKEKIQGVTEIYNRLGIREICEAAIAEYCRKAEEALGQVKVDEDKKKELLQLLYMLTDRGE